MGCVSVVVLKLVAGGFATNGASLTSLFKNIFWNPSSYIPFTSFWSQSLLKLDHPLNLPLHKTTGNATNTNKNTKKNGTKYHLNKDLFQILNSIHT